MTFLIFNSFEEAEVMNKKINDYMFKNIKGYNAKQWSRILTDNNGKFAIYIKTQDKRNPTNCMDLATKIKIVDVLPDEFFHLTDSEKNKIPNYVVTK